MMFTFLAVTAALTLARPNLVYILNDDTDLLLGSTEVRDPVLSTLSVHSAQALGKKTEGNNPISVFSRRLTQRFPVY